MDVEEAYVRLALDERRLLWERESLLSEIDDAEGQIGSLDGEPGGRSEAAASVFEREKDVGLVEDLDAALGEIADARKRIEAGTFGRCEACDEMIDEERLDAIPAARFCIVDAREHERPLGGIDL